MKFKDRIKWRLDRMPNKYKMWNGIVMTEDVWIDKAMKVKVETPLNPNVNPFSFDSKRVET